MSLIKPSLLQIEEPALLDLLFPMWKRSVLLGQPIPENLARVHLRELGERLLASRDLRPGTRGEMLFLISEASMEAKLSAPAVRTYQILFARAFPEQNQHLFSGDVPEVGYEEEIVLDELVRRTYRADRTLEAVVEDALWLSILTPEQEAYYKTLI